MSENNIVYYVYKIINCINNKIYIGKHKGLINDNYLGSGKIIKQAIIKYGKENFKKEILIICNDNEEANYWEKYYIQEFNSFQPNGYNISSGGDWGDVLTHNPNRNEILKHMSESSSRTNKHLKQDFPGHSKAVSKRNKIYCSGKKIEELYSKESCDRIRKAVSKNITLINKNPFYIRVQQLGKIKKVYNNFLLNYKFSSIIDIVEKVKELKKNNIINKYLGISFRKELWEEIIGYKLDD